ncbi:MAG TPA: hypothetical protein VGM83_03840 [Devosiaceae bacterium]|jgi:hypothetical protein
MSYRLRDYEQLLGSLSGRKPVGIAGFLDFDFTGRQNSVLLRHDVDRLAWRAVRMARLESRHAIRSTYYFRCTPDGRFPETAIAAIHALGHEVGYHYECLSACNGDRIAALVQFRRNLEIFRRLAPCRTVAMHGAPLSRHNNQDLLLGCHLQEFDLIADASLSFSDVELAYFTDTGGRWNAGGAINFRDRVGMNPSRAPVPGVAGFGAWISDYADPIYISTHPERWPQSRGGFIVAKLTDILTNLAKQAVRTVSKMSTNAHRS